MDQARLCAVTGCGQPMPSGDNSTACPDCWARHAARVARIPALVDDLQTALARQTALGSSDGRRSPEVPLPYSVAASDALRLLHGTLWPWVKEGLDAHPDQPTPRPGTVGFAACLAELHGWLQGHPDGHDAVDEVAYAVGQATRAVDRAPDRVYAGTCDSRDQAGEACGTELYAVEGQPMVTCPKCEWERDVAAWRYARLEDAADQLLTLSELTRAIAETSRETISRKRLEKWVERGRLVRAGNVGSVATYRVGDVLDIIFADLRRAAG